MNNYGIKPDYQHREDAWAFDDTPFTDEFQVEVYEYAAEVASSMSAVGVIDLGCGSGFKLMKHFSHLLTMGVDVEATVNFLRDKYPDREWFVTGTTIRCFDGVLLICSDVIEHLANPDELLDYIERIGPTEFIISTPDRVELALGTEDGPPRNIHHYREWTHDEFVFYIGSRFTVVESFRGKTIVVRAKVR